MVSVKIAQTTGEKERGKRRRRKSLKRHMRGKDAITEKEKGQKMNKMPVEGEIKKNGRRKSNGNAEEAASHEHPI